MAMWSPILTTCFKTGPIYDTSQSQIEQLFFPPDPPFVCTGTSRSLNAATYHRCHWSLRGEKLPTAPCDTRPRPQVGTCANGWVEAEEGDESPKNATL